MSAEAHEESLRLIELGIEAEKIPFIYANEVYMLREHIDLARRQFKTRR